MAKINTIIPIPEAFSFSFDLNGVFIMENRQVYKIRNKLTRSQILTIPNLLSFFRLALIPVIVYFYAFLHSSTLTVATLLISGVTDVCDGFIARNFNMVSDFGKAIDPLADKLTQLAVLFCLLSRFPLIILPIAVMVVKEVGSFVLRLIMFKKTERVDSAEWHGKVNTLILYTVLLLHIVWIDIPYPLSTASIILSAITMVTSCVLYSISAIRVLAEDNKST